MTEREQVVLNGRYELERRVGRGGMAEVFLARDRLLDRPVAIKILFPEFATDPSFVERFRREAQSAANLNHPNIVGVYDWGKERGTYYIVMEYIDGRSVSDIIRADGPIEAKRAAGIAAEVASALGFAHQKGVVHRDVKPGNVLITGDGEVKVADFGIARALTASGQENLTQTGSVMGTATYFSPEQAQGRPADPRSDLYSLGVVLYEMSSGKPPFTADSPVAIAYKHVQEPVPSLRERVPNVPAAYEAITLKALSKDVAGRYQDAKELRQDLLRFRDGRPVTAPAVGVADGGPPTQATDAVPMSTAPPPMNRPPTGRPPTDARSYTGPETEEEPNHARSGWFFAAILILLLVLGGLLFAFASQLGIFESQKAKVEVVDVVGDQQEIATQKLENLGLKVGEVTTEASTKPQGEVLTQDPTAGTTVENGSTVALTVSGGPKTATLPGDDLVGKTLNQARALLKDAGFTGPITVEERESIQDVGTVLQSKPGGGELAVDTPITLVVAKAVATTTAAPTTAPPTTAAPTTAAPTTAAPTTAAPATTSPPAPTTTSPPAPTSTVAATTTTV